jgi:hypothetical protein
VPLAVCSAGSAPKGAQRPPLKRMLLKRTRRTDRPLIVRPPMSERPAAGRSKGLRSKGSAQKKGEQTASSKVCPKTSALPLKRTPPQRTRQGVCHRPFPQKGSDHKDPFKRERHGSQTKGSITRWRTAKGSAQPRASRPHSRSRPHGWPAAQNLAQNRRIRCRGQQRGQLSHVNFELRFTSLCTGHGPCTRPPAQSRALEGRSSTRSSSRE